VVDGQEEWGFAYRDVIQIPFWLGQRDRSLIKASFQDKQPRDPKVCPKPPAQQLRKTRVGVCKQNTQNNREKE
jgi:hypothetical protein